MTATPNYFSGWAPEHIGTQLPTGDNLPLAASAQAGQGQALFFDSAGNVALNDGTAPGLVCAGITYPEKLTETSTIAAAKRAMVHQGMGSGAPASTTSLDGFTKADQCVVAWDAGNGVPGKLSHSGANDRSMIGLVFGIDDVGNPRIWAGPQAHAVARGVHLATRKLLGWFAHPVDGAANTTTAEKTMMREPLHGVITGIRFTSLGTIAADATDYVQIKVYKADGAGGTHVLVGTYDSRAAQQDALVAGTPKAFALSAVAGALNLLETDILTYEVAKAAAGKIVPVGTLEVFGKVI